MGGGALAQPSRSRLKLQTAKCQADAGVESIVNLLMRLKSGKKMFSVAVWLAGVFAWMHWLKTPEWLFKLEENIFGVFFVKICAQILMCQFVVQICAQQNNCCAQICFTCVFGTHNVIIALGQMWSLMQLNRHKIAVFEKN